MKGAETPVSVLDGKEVWAFNPSSQTVHQGDTVDIQLVNPSRDAHTLTLADLWFNLDVKAQGEASGSLVASKVGAFRFACGVPEHMPFMWGQLVVLPDSSAPQS
ncbi:MAG TPA: cupredoxin domain-containing protein [Actinomycetota bacterium]